MKLKVITGLVLTLFLVSTLAMTFNITLTRASGTTIYAKPPNDDTNRERYARLLWENITNLQVNSSFPFVYTGSSSQTDEAISELLTGAVLYLQTGSTTYLEKPRELCEWLNTSGQPIMRLWDAYNVKSKSWTRTAFRSMGVSSAIQQLSVYVNISSEWAPLLQQAVNEALWYYIPSNTYRTYFTVNRDHTVADSTCTAETQSYMIQAMSIASKVLSNETLKNVAYRMIMNYTLGSANLPYHVIYQNGNPEYYFCKQDASFGEYLLAMETFYYYYPDSTTVKNRIYDVASAGAKYVYIEPRFRYMTNADTGANLSPSSVWGFGLTEEAMLTAGLIFNNNTWINQVEKDFETEVMDGYQIYNGCITHSPTGPTSHQSGLGYSVHGRRAGTILYGYTRNQTYLRYSAFLFDNETRLFQRPLGWAAQVNLLTGDDYAGYSNRRGDLYCWLRYVNRTTVQISRYQDVFDYYGIPHLGNPQISHNVGITGVSLSKNVVGVGYFMDVDVFVKNEGHFIESFNVTLLYGNNTIGTRTLTNVAPGTLKKITFTWNTAGVPKGTHTISAKVSVVPNETVVIDNTYIDGTVWVSIPGDITGYPIPSPPDGKVWVEDLYLFGKAWGSKIGDPDYNPLVDFTSYPIPSTPNGYVWVEDLWMFGKNWGKTDC